MGWGGERRRRKEMERRGEERERERGIGMVRYSEREKNREALLWLLC